MTKKAMVGNICNIRISYVLAIGSITMIYFQIYWHYWFVKLLGGYIVNTLLPIMILFCVFFLRKVISSDQGRIKRKTFYLVIILFCYVLFASISIIINEEGFENIKRYFIYIYSPVIIFISILGLHIYKKNENIEKTINILFIVATIFSIYVATVYILKPESIKNLPNIETNRGEFNADSGGGYGIGDLQVEYRFTIPGLGSTSQYGPILAPLILFGIYFIKISLKYKRLFYFCATLFLSFCLIMTVSRGPVISFLVGLIYVTCWKVFKPKEILLLVGFALIMFFVSAKLIIFRILLTVAMFLPIDVSFMGDTALDLMMADIRINAYEQTLPHIFDNPLWGMGLREFNESKNELSLSNNYFIVLLSFGLFSAIFYIIFISLLYLMLHRHIKKLSANHPTKIMGIFLGGGMVAFLVFLNVSFVDAHFIWVWFGLTAAWIRNCTNDMGRVPCYNLGSIVNNYSKHFSLLKRV